MPLSSQIIDPHPQYTRYAQWFFNAPLVIMTYSVHAGFPLIDSLLPLLMTDAAVVLGLFGTLAPQQYKWAYFIMSVSALFNVFGHLLSNTVHGAHSTSTYQTRMQHVRSIFALASIWTIYPIIWAFSEGWGVISTADTAIYYGFADLLSGPVFLVYILWTHEYEHVEPIEFPRDTKA
ncbi:hypothetical protein HETIRDRAFT_323141 [Heterobasidion irregulare TC 32-1]|uniref:Uncharacterized protein n=1 Tax=Heterobasidion irregulare (strain TC 32-1) TaxID=747525 RepID=W4K0B0_HETIT|nr:uncharacterized protein HETIRDRAFT_323141 [Heterobasidion irregulare TC 32-1]ETW79164.1 hypothetical protein HETIRDRAFT_323141 [Heterobasidion irregulare TC 32-1]